MSQVKELDGNWAGVEIYRSKKNPDDVVLFFGGDEYEGLEGGYRYAKGPDNRMVLKDSDGGVIELRGRPSSKKRKLNSKQPKRSRLRPSNKYVGVCEKADGTTGKRHPYPPEAHAFTYKGMHPADLPLPELDWAVSVYKIFKGKYTASCLSVASLLVM